MTLYRPVGLFEYRLIEESGFARFPPRLYWQPIFYPVLTESYAVKIAREWNTADKASGYVGYVTKFEVDGDYAARFEVHVVGNEDCQELWVPSEELEDFNAHLRGKIEIVEIFKGPDFDENAVMPAMLKEEF